MIQSFTHDQQTKVVFKLSPFTLSIRVDFCWASQYMFEGVAVHGAEVGAEVGLSVQEMKVACIGGYALFMSMTVKFI